MGVRLLGSQGKPLICLDMDEVFVDFAEAALKAHGIKREELEAKRRLGTWSMADVLKISKFEFWEPIHALGTGFWEYLNWLPWGKRVIEVVANSGIDWVVVTTQSSSADNEEASHAGKIRWLKREFGSDFDRYQITAYKQLLAGPNRYLIDDSFKNCLNFNLAGGMGLVFPSYGNLLIKHAQNPIPIFERYIRGIHKRK